MLEEFVYDIEGKECIGQGGTKYVYLMDENTVIAVPNSMDGEELINKWPRIIEEELEISEKIDSINVPVLKLSKCKVKWNNEIFDTISSKPFASYVKEGIYIIDTKSINSTQWPKDGSLNLISGDKFDFDLWVKILQPVITDIVQLSKHNIFLPKDARNIAYVAKGSKLHSGSELPFEVRLWCFDFANKNGEFKMIGKKVKFSEKYFLLRYILEMAVWEEVAPRESKLSKTENKLWKDLVKHFKPQIKFDDDSQEEYNNPRTMSDCCIQ